MGPGRTKGIHHRGWRVDKGSVDGGAGRQGSAEPNGFLDARAIDPVSLKGCGSSCARMAPRARGDEPGGLTNPGHPILNRQRLPAAFSSVGPDSGWRPDNPVFQWGERIGSAILDGVVAPLECGSSASKPIG
jgi:hypothetical protein